MMGVRVLYNEQRDQLRRMKEKEKEDRPSAGFWGRGSRAKGFFFLAGPGGDVGFPGQSLSHR
jgi:hypothetical protein